MIPYYYDANDKSTYRMMNQTGVSLAIHPNPTTHNACWDSLLGPRGEVYFSLCSELTTSEYAKLAVYHPKENRIEELHYTKDIIFPNDRFIRDSKLHTSMAWMRDGRMIALTHTTDKSPEHPIWNPLAHYNDPWSGYPGSSMLCYDPVTGEMQNWGIPVARETLYGGTYDSINHIYYALGFLRGHLYGIDLTTRGVRDYGQAVEKASYRLVVGSDDNIYYTTKNGILQRINVRSKEIENLNIQLPYKVEAGRQRPYMSFATNGPDGKLYIAGMQDEHLSCYDPFTGEFRVVGRYSPAEIYAKGIASKVYMGAMAFDKNHVLYYVICNTRSEGGKHFSQPSMLMRWDLLHNKDPEILGFPGTPERTTSATCSLVMDRERDRMFIIGTNHGLDGPHVVQVDLASYRDHATEFGPLAEDPFAFPDNDQEEYARFAEEQVFFDDFSRENPTDFTFGTVIPVELWKAFADGDKENSHVASLTWEGEHLIALCGVTRFTRFILDRDGHILSQSPWDPPSNTKTDCPINNLPSYPGRQYNREAMLEVPLSEGRSLVATRDGMLAIRQKDRIFSLGIVWPNGPVNAMTVSPDQTKVYGVAGDRDDFGVVFSYDDDTGVHVLGHVVNFSITHGQFSSPYLTSIALNGDGRQLAIGSGGRMGTLYLYSK